MKNQSKKILIVEDELIIALTIEKMVQRLGHQVVGTVTSGEQAVNLVLENTPDLILMDIRLQGELDGIETMEEIRKQTNTPVIYITGNTDEQNKNRVKESDYLAFLTKPISIHDLDQSFNFAS
ncbi:MAG: response regulator [Balneolaceae bacterium]|nr:response regulator [Balneolaceae bacterium]